MDARRWMVAGCCAVSVLCLSGEGLASEGFYGGLSVARTEVRDFCDDLGSQLSLSSCDESSTGWRVFFGYRFAQVVGLELEYSGFGESGATVTTTAGDTGKVTGSGLGLSLELRAPVM